MASRSLPTAAARSRRHRDNDGARLARVAIVAMCGALAFGWKGPVDAWQQAEGTCRITGRAMSGAVPLPGVSVRLAMGGYNLINMNNTAGAAGQ